MPSRPPSMAPSPRHSGVRRISGRIPDSTVQVRVGTHGSSNGPTHDPTPQDRLSSFSIHYTNIRGLNSNFSSAESHLATSSPNLFLLSETSCQVNLPLTLSKSPTITFTLVSAQKVVSALTVT